MKKLLFDHDEIIETRRMLKEEQLDIRTVTMGISILDCVHSDPEIFCRNVSSKILEKALNLNDVCAQIQSEYGISIVNRRISITPISIVASSPSFTEERYIEIAKMLDKTAEAVKADFIGGFGSCIQKGFTNADRILMKALPSVLSSTNRVCGFLNVATTRSGINMDAVVGAAEIIKKTSELTSDKNGIGSTKFVVFANAVEDSPFMAGAFHGIGEPEAEIHVGISGPGVIKSAVNQSGNCNFENLTENIKKFAFKVTRLGQLVSTIAAEKLGVEKGIIDLSLAPSPKVGDSVAEILEAMGLESVGGPGSTAALALLNDAVKRGGLMATSNTGGLSGSFIPVTEDLGLAAAAQKNLLSIEKLEAMTAVCSVGLDMIPIPGNTSISSIAGIIADEMAIGVWNHKTTGVRLIPVPHAKPGDQVHFGGLMGEGPVMRVSEIDCSNFVFRGGRISGPITGFRN